MDFPYLLRSLSHSIWAHGCFRLPLSMCKYSTTIQYLAFVFNIFYKRKTEIIKNIFGLFLGLICVCIGICMANLYSSVKATCANYNRLVRIEEGHIPPPSYQRAEEIGVELIDLPPPEPNIQESAKQKFASSPSNNKTKRKKYQFT